MEECSDQVDPLPLVTDQPTRRHTPQTLQTPKTSKLVSVGGAGGLEIPVGDDEKGDLAA